MSINVQSIQTKLGGTTILHDISLRVEQGEMLAIVGPNGSGKSTLLRTIAGVLRSDHGSVQINNEPIETIKKKTLAHRLGFLSQSADVPQLTTVHEHVSLGRHTHRGMFSGQSREDIEQINAAMDICQINHLAHRRVADLSGGERQRVRLATLLAQNPQSLLLDEPLNGLDIEHQLAILELLKSVNQERQKTVLCVLHDLELALRYFDRIIVIDQGRICEDGQSEHVLCPEVFKKVFNVNGRISQDLTGIPVVICQHPQCVDSCPNTDSKPEIHVRSGIQLTNSSTRVQSS